MVCRGHATFLSGINDLLLVGEASNAQDIVRVCSKVQAHVILVDIYLPTMEGITLTRPNHALHPDVQVVILTS